MLNEGTWVVFRSLLKASKRKVVVESHIKFLDTCKKEHLTPIGMRYKPKVTFKHLNENKKYNDMLTNTSKKTLNSKMTYKSFVKEHKTLKSQILKEESNLKKVATHEEIKFVQGKIIKTCRVTQCKMDKIKERKLENLKKAVTDNLPNEDIQILNVDNYLQHKRNRRKINNKRKRSAKVKRRWRQGKWKKKEQDLIEKLKNIELPSEDRFRPYDNTSYEMTDIEMQVCAKGLKFVPSVKRVDRHQKHLDLIDLLDC